MRAATCMILVVYAALLSGSVNASPTFIAYEHEEVGSIITDQDGRSVYTFAEDPVGESACYDECADLWPPIVADGAPEAGSGVAGSLLGTIERADGELQVTYNGMPLYYFTGDAEAGDIVGHGEGGAWFLVSPYGRPVRALRSAPGDAGDTEAEAVAEEEVDAPEPIAEELVPVMELAAPLYSRHCSSCHGGAGDGGVGPSFRNNDSLERTDYVVRQILRGSQYMPAFGDVLTDEEVAAVATYIRNSWGNHHGAVTEKEVVDQR